MKELTISAKELRKAAFAVGFGLYFGKEVAKFVDQTVCGTIGELIKKSAKDGNEFAQKVCEKNDVKYTEESEEEKPEVKMGFHV